MDFEDYIRKTFDKYEGLLVMIKKRHYKTFSQWNEEDIALLRKLYSTTTNKELARKLNKSVSSIEKKGSQLKLTKSREFRQEINKQNASSSERCRIWTNEEIEFKKLNYKKMSGKRIAEKLERSYPSIIYKVQQLGMNKNKKKNKKVKAKIS